MFVKTLVIAALGLLACEATPTPTYVSPAEPVALAQRAAPSCLSYGYIYLYPQINFGGKYQYLLQADTQQDACALFAQATTVESYASTDIVVVLYNSRDCTGSTFTIGPGNTGVTNNANSGPFNSYILLYDPQH